MLSTLEQLKNLSVNKLSGSYLLSSLRFSLNINFLRVRSVANTPSGEVRRGLSAFTSHNFHGDKTMPRGNQYKLNNDTSYF